MNTEGAPVKGRYIVILCYRYYRTPMLIRKFLKGKGLTKLMKLWQSREYTTKSSPDPKPLLYRETSTLSA